MPATKPVKDMVREYIVYLEMLSKTLRENLENETNEKKLISLVLDGSNPVLSMIKRFNYRKRSKKKLSEV